MTVYFDNPAGRLYRVLTALKDAQPQTMSMRDAWNRVLGVAADKGDVRLLSRRVAEVFQLPAMVTARLMEIEEDFYDRDFVTRWFNPVQTTFSESLFTSNQLNQVLHFDRESMASLESCSYVLHKYRSEPMPPTSELQSVLEHISSVEALIDEDIAISPALAEFIRYHAQAIREAIDDFSLAGGTHIQKAVDEAAGAAVRRRYFLRRDGAEVPENEAASRGALKRFWEMLNHAAVVVAMVGELAAIGQAAYTDFETHTPAIENTVVVNDSPHSDVIVVDTDSEH